MARRLSRPGPAVPGARHGARFAVLVLAVIGGHALVTRELVDRMDRMASAAREPARIDVAYVRTLEPEAPPEVAPSLPAPVVPKKRRLLHAAPARAASAVEPTMEKPARPPEAVADAASQAASAAADVMAAVSAPQPADDMAASKLPPVEMAALSDASAASASTSASASESAMTSASGATSTSTSTSVLASTAEASATSRPFDWPASTRVSFDLQGNYRGAVSGSAQVEWVRVGSRYQVHLDLLVGPAFAPIIARRMSSEGELTAAGLTPSRYDEETRVVLREPRHVTVLFPPDAVVLSNGQQRERWPGIQDTASQFIQLTYLFTTRPELLRIGQSIEVPLALARSMDHWIYDVLDEAVIDTSFGPLQTFHLKPRRATARPGDLTAEIWFAPQLRYLPVRIRIEQDPQTYVDLVIARKPEMAADTSR